MSLVVSTVDYDASWEMYGRAQDTERQGTVSELPVYDARHLAIILNQEIH